MTDDNRGSVPRVVLTKRSTANPPPVQPPVGSDTPAAQVAPTRSQSSARNDGPSSTPSKSANRASMPLAAVVVGVLVVGGGAYFLGRGSAADGSRSDTTSAQSDETIADDPAVLEDDVDDSIEPQPPPPPRGPAAPMSDRSGHPIVKGWFVLVSSALKGTVEVRALPRVAARTGGQVVDTDFYQTGFATDGRSGTLNQQAAVAPSYWPGANAVGVVLGPFPSRSATETECQRRGAPLGSCVRQFRVLPSYARQR